MAYISNLARIGLWLLLSGITGTLLVLASAYLYLSPKLPPVDSLRDIQLQIPLRVYTSDGELIGEFGEKRRTPLNYQQIPRPFINAILAAEDDGFYEHNGVAIPSLLRAVSELILTGEKGSGGSTITMQVARNYFLSFDRVFSRKFNEILLSLQIERELSKQQILELYVNKIFLGNRAYGFEAAAQVYYGKSLAELELAQWAMLAGVPKAPSKYNPLANPERATIRRNWILGRMNKLDFIDDATYQQAVEQPVSARRHGSKLTANAPFVAEMARKDMLRRYGRAAYTEGYKVYTTLDSTLQQRAYRAVIDGLIAYDRRHGYRGPEQNLSDVANINTPDLEGNVEGDEEDTNEQPVDTINPQHASWLKTISALSEPGELMPAVVTAVQQQSFNALLADGSEVQIGWEQGLQNQRSFITVNQRGPKPKTASDIVAEGDVVRLQQQADASWRLSQLPAAQASLVSLNADNGAIISLVGGFNYRRSNYNRITQATRQPGSSFKPFIYSAALANGYTPASIINDSPISIDDEKLETSWRPTNADQKFDGPMRLRKALYRSRNLVSIRLLRDMGIGEAIDYVQKFGFDTKKLPKDLSLALGSHSLTPLQIVSGYAVLANGGYRVEPYFIQRIEDINGETVFLALPTTVCRDCERAEPATPELSEANTLEDIFEQVDTVAELPAAERVLDERIAFLMDDMLKDVVVRGTARKARSLGRSDLAGKTGTTNGPTDAWFSGYGGGIVTTTWLGFDNNSLLGSREYGGSAALPIWIDYMKSALAGVPETRREQPKGIVSVKIDPDTGQLAKPGQRNAIFEIFQNELAPSEAAGTDAVIASDTDIEEELEENIF